MALELRQLRHVLALAQHGSLGRAAVALNMTQPALSRSLKLIEWEIGSVLFDRSAKGVTPTDQGRLVIRRARELVDAADDLDREVLRQRVGGTDQIIVGAGAYAAETVVTAALARFLPANELARIRVVVRGNFDELPRLLRARQLDFLVAEFSTLVGQDDLDIQPLDRHQAYFMARKGHPLEGRPFSQEAMFEFPFVALSQYPPRVLQPMLAARRPVDVRRPGRPFPTLECSSVEAAKRIVAATDAITPLLLTMAEEELRRGTLVSLGTEHWCHSHYAIVRLKSHSPTETGARFLRELEMADAGIVREEARLAKKFVPAEAATRRRASAGSRR